MPQWNVTNITDNSVYYSFLGSIPIEIDPFWLVNRVNSSDEHIQFYLQGNQDSPCGYAPFFVHPDELNLCLGESILFSIPVQKYVIQGSPLFKDYFSLIELFKCLRKDMVKNGVVFIEAVRKSSQLAELLTATDSPLFKFFYVMPYGPAYKRRLIKLPAGARFEDYLETISKSTSKHLCRLINNFEVKAGNKVKITYYTKSEQTDELVTIMKKISRKTYQHHLLKLGIENNPEQIAEICRAATHGWLRAYILWIGKTPVAFNVGYQHGYNFYGHYMGHDPEFSKLQPGMYLYTEVMRDLLSNGVHFLDLLPGDNLLKQRMSNTSREEQPYYLIPKGWPGTANAFILWTSCLISESIGKWLDKMGIKARIKQLIRNRSLAKT